jgi:hypothetical protein
MNGLQIDFESKEDFDRLVQLSGDICTSRFASELLAKAISDVMVHQSKLKIVDPPEFD